MQIQTDKAILLPNETIKCTNLNYPLKPLFEVKQVRLITTFIEITFASLLHLLIEYPKATVSKKTIGLDGFPRVPLGFKFLVF